MENDNEIITSTNDTETTENNEEVETTEESTESTGNIDVEALKKEVATLKAQKEHWKKKAEKGTDDTSKTEAKSEPSLSLKDSILLAKAEVDLEDVDEVLAYAEYKKISLQDALKSPTLKGIIAERKEERATAIATQTKTKTQPTKNTNEAILERYHNGEEVDPDKLAEARMAQKLANKGN